MVSGPRVKGIPASSLSFGPRVLGCFRAGDSGHVQGEV